MHRSIYFVLIVVIFTACNKKSTEWPDMQAGWYFKAKTDSVWLTASVPGLVHTDLFSHQRIDEPFYRNNESKLQWISKKEWIYKKEFDFQLDQLGDDMAWLEFEGLDTYADVFLNDKLIWQTENMFVGKSIRVDNILKNGTNVLKVHFYSTIKEGLKRFDKINYKLPVSANDDDTLGGIHGKRISVFTRKAPYQFGWDFAPRFISAGIWRPVQLVRRKSKFINDVQIHQKELTDSIAHLEINTQVFSNTSDSICLTISFGKEKLEIECLKVQEGFNDLTFQMKVENPKFWWPIGYGNQYLYNVEVLLKWADKKKDKYQLKYGFRNIDIIQEKDSIGRSFYFRVNGQDMFARGANMVPMSSFPHQVSKSDLRGMMKNVVNANMNMIRIWGGGIYPDEYFYHLCDSLGILVWQDFMFACSMVPDYPGYFGNFENEAVYNIKRLRNHPSLAIWCGNNEVVSAWNNWGWRKKEEREQGKAVADRIWGTYDSLFHKFIPNILNQHDPERFYWSSSPQSAPGVAKSDTSGDRHYWMVWWGERPFNEFFTNAGRFMSEYGFQSIPSISNLRKAMRENDLGLRTDGFLAHQKSTGGNNRLKNYLDMYFTSNTKFENYPYLTQLLQARAMSTAIKAHRTQKPYCMGSLLWQMNDVWPAASWSIIDFYGEKKAAYYAVQEAFEPVAVFADTLNNAFSLNFVCDKNEPLEIEFTCKIKEFDGTLFTEFVDQIAVDNRVNKLWTPSFEESLIFDWSKMYLLIEYKVVGETFEKILLLKDDRNLHLPKPQYSYEIEKKSYGAELQIKSPVFIRSMYVSFPPYDVDFNQNFFDIEPNKPISLQINSKVEFEVLESSIHFKNINAFDLSE